MCNSSSGLSHEYIRTLFKMLTGSTESTTEQWQPLLLSAEKALLNRIKLNVDINVENDRLCMAVAGIAAAHYRSYQTTAGEEIRVGGISLKSNASGSKTHNGADYLAQISDLLLPEGFAFMQTPEEKT